MHKDGRKNYFSNLSTNDCCPHLPKPTKDTTFKMLSLTCFIILWYPWLSVKNQYFLNGINYAYREYTSENKIVPGLLWEVLISEGFACSDLISLISFGPLALVLLRYQQALHPSLSWMKRTRIKISEETLNVHAEFFVLLSSLVFFR